MMNSNDLVKDILKRDQDQQEKILKSTEVTKACPVDIDLGNLLLWDPNVVDQAAYKYFFGSFSSSFDVSTNNLEKIEKNTFDKR